MCIDCSLLEPGHILCHVRTVGFLHPLEPALPTSKDSCHLRSWLPVLCSSYGWEGKNPWEPAQTQPVASSQGPFLVVTTRSLQLPNSHFYKKRLASDKNNNRLDSLARCLLLPTGLLPGVSDRKSWIEELLVSFIVRLPIFVLREETPGEVMAREVRGSRR